MSVENFDNVIGLSCKIKEGKADCKLLELVGWEEIAQLRYRDVHGLIPHIEKYGTIAKRTIDDMYIYSPDELHIKSVYSSLQKGDERLEIIFMEPKKCAIAIEKERGRFLTCPAYLYSKDDKRLKSE